ncbi:endonuclease III [bacterium]|nr:endonuclease III [bacterium]
MKDIAKALKEMKKMKLPRTEFVRFMEDIHNPFIVLIACILSLRTNDKTTYPATMRMLELGKTIDDFSLLSPDVLEKAIYPVGFYKNKAKQIVEIAKKIKEEYNSTVPDTIEELVKFNGVGRKTANLVLAKGHNKPAICVDVHVHRISNRLGLVKTNTPEETEFALKDNLEEKYWTDLNTEFVTFGQNICKPVNPKCPDCPLSKACDYYIKKPC